MSGPCMQLASLALPTTPEPDSEQLHVGIVLEHLKCLLQPRHLRGTLLPADVHMSTHSFATTLCISIHAPLLENLHRNYVAVMDVQRMML